jgi:3-methyladenine DNA glycosylase/8-oxoguanine DNA glycosylase
MTATTTTPTAAPTAIPTATLTTTEVEVRGPFDLTESARFLEGFTPAARTGAAGEPGTLLLAFPVDGSWRHVGVRIRQSASGTVHVATAAPPDAAAVAVAQTRRILSLDVDGTGFADVGRADPVIGALQKRNPGLRPVLFHSPYEAACWAIISSRIRMTQAAAIKQRIAEHHGQQVQVGGQLFVSFPAPGQLRALPAIAGVSELKVQRLHGIADAAMAGELDAGPLRAVEPEVALERLRRLPGIGPFSAQLILARGAGHPDVFPRNERRLHAEMAFRYGVPADDPAALDEIAQRWRPLRSWAGLLLRSDRERRTGEITKVPR